MTSTMLFFSAASLPFVSFSLDHPKIAGGRGAFGSTGASDREARGLPPPRSRFFWARHLKHVKFVVWPGFQALVIKLRLSSVMLRSAILFQQPLHGSIFFLASKDGLTSQFIEMAMLLRIDVPCSEAFFLWRS